MRTETILNKLYTLIPKLGNNSEIVNFFYVLRTMHFEMKLYDDQSNEQVFNLSTYFCLTGFGLSFSPSSEVGV
jgi:hypothetical protein